MNLPGWTRSLSPLASTLSNYGREQLAGDLVAGLVVAVMLVPQAMAYAMLAGLPPQIGLYASILPLILYSLFGTSRSLAVGPVAMVSLLVVSGVGELATPGSPQFIQLCLTLALLVGIMQILMAAFRLGFLVNFISHPVLVGFTSAAAIVIGFSQFKHLFGIAMERGEYPFELIKNSLTAIGGFNPATLAIGLASCAVLLLFCYCVAPALRRLGVREPIASTIAKTGPLVAVMLAAIVVFGGKLHEAQSVAIVGAIPAGLPLLTMPDFSLATVGSLLPLALVITVVGYLESISVAKALASRDREKISANRELFALGMADIGAAFTGGYPVTGGFSRSIVNYSAGVRTPVGSIITAGLVAVSVLFLTPLFFYIPKTVLAAIIVVAVVRLIDVKTPIALFRYSRPDAIALMITFVGVLAMGIETGIFIGVVSTIVLLVRKMSQPHIAVVGRVGESEHFRNILRHDVTETDGLLAIRIDEDLNFTNAPFVESFIQQQISGKPAVNSVLLVASGINDIDATGIETLKTIIRELNSADIKFFMSDVKGPVTDRLNLAGFDSLFLERNVFLSAHQAIEKIAGECELGNPPSPPEKFRSEQNAEVLAK